MPAAAQRNGYRCAARAIDLAMPMGRSTRSAAAVSATLGVFVRFQIAHINLRFVFLFFAHITFLQLVFWFWVVSVAPNSCCPPTTFSFEIRPSKWTSFSFERFCR